MSRKERRQRLSAGIIAGTASVGWALLQSKPDIISLVLGLASLGFFANYITCFCGTKKMLKKLLN